MRRAGRVLLGLGLAAAAGAVLVLATARSRRRSRALGSLVWDKATGRWEMRAGRTVIGRGVLQEAPGT